MFISPVTAIENGWVTHPQCTTVEDFKKHNFVSPNALDFTLDRMFIPSDDVFYVSETSKSMRKQHECHPEAKGGEYYFTVLPNSFVDCMSSFHVTIPNEVAALLVVRSTLNRNGLFITSGLYDSGFTNYLGFCLHNRGAESKIAQGTRVGQIMFFKSERSDTTYSGQYNKNKGQHWSST